MQQKSVKREVSGKPYLKDLLVNEPCNHHRSQEGLNMRLQIKIKKSQYEMKREKLKIRKKTDRVSTIIRYKMQEWNEHLIVAQTRVLQQTQS